MVDHKTVKSALKWLFTSTSYKAGYIRFGLIIAVIIILPMIFSGSPKMQSELEQKFADQEANIQEKSKEFDGKIDAFNKRQEVRKNKMDESFNNMHSAWEELELSKQKEQIKKQIENEQWQKVRNRNRQIYLENLAKTLSIDFNTFAKYVEVGRDGLNFHTTSKYHKWLKQYEDAFYGIIMNCAINVKNNINNSRNNALATQRLKESIERDLASGKLNEHQSAGKENYLKKIIGADLSTNEDFLHQKAIQANRKCIAESKFLMPYIEKYSPFLDDNRTFDNLSYHFNTGNYHVSFGLGLTYKQIIDKEKYLMAIGTPEVENINAKKYIEEISKGKKGRLYNIIQDKQYDKNACQRGKDFFCPIKVTKYNRASLR